jgi:hypothetical protein
MVAFASFANAQQPMPRKHGNKIEFRVKRMADRLMLDDSQKEKFAPLYKEYLEAKAACRPQLVFGKELTDEQIENNLEQMMDVREKSLKIDKKYYKKLSKVLDAKQLDMIFGFKAHAGKRPMAHGKEMKSMPPRRNGKQGAPHGKCHMPKECKQGADCKKGEGCKMNDGCKKAADCKKIEGACKDGKECKMKADCKKECKLDGKCAKGDACPKAGECKKDAACKSECPKAKDCNKECKK